MYIAAVCHSSDGWFTDTESSLYKSEFRIKQKQILTKSWISEVETIDPKPSNEYRQQEGNVKFLTIP